MTPLIRAIVIGVAIVLGDLLGGRRWRAVHGGAASLSRIVHRIDVTIRRPRSRPVVEQVCL